jgi:hypothetical protein
MKNFFNYVSRPENLTNLAAFFVAIILSYRGIQSGQVQEYFQALLVVLSILALSQLVAGYSATQRDNKIQNLNEGIARLNEQMVLAQITADELITRRANVERLDSIFRNAKQIDVLGLSLVGILTMHYSLIKNRLEAGCKMRFMMMNPKNRHIGQIVADREPDALHLEMLIRHINTSLKTLGTLPKQTEHGGTLEVAIINTLPSFGLLIVDGDSNQGVLRIELYPHSCSIPDRPVIQLSAARDGDWYNFFKTQFEILWKKAGAIKIS